MSLTDDLDLMARLADEADRLTLPAWESGSVEVSTKPDGSPVTETDVAVETRLRTLVAEAHPDDGFLGEEVGRHPGSSSRTWVVDGIDGTRAFTIGRPEWSTFIALVVAGHPVAGLVTSPSLGQRWSGSEGRAAEVTGRDRTSPLVTTSAANLAAARVLSWPPIERCKPEFRPLVERVADLAESHDQPSRGAGVPNGAMLVAEGRIDAFLCFSGRTWDHAATAAVITAAGGRFSGLDGTASVSTGGGIYSNGPVHEDLLDRLLPDRRPEAD